MVGVVGLVDMMGLVGLVLMGGRVGRHVVVRLQSGQLVHLEGSEGKEWFLSNTDVICRLITLQFAHICTQPTWGVGCGCEGLARSA